SFSLKHLKALRKYFWKYRIRLSIGILFVILSNYFNVMAPQFTGFVINYVQQRLPGYKPPAHTQGYDGLVKKLTGWIADPAFSPLKVVALFGLIILMVALLRGFFLFLMRQTIIVMSRHIEY